jgi:putative nucleotidyltransferase with HDIG domain
MAQLQQAYVSSLTTLANAIDQRDPASSGHVNRLTDYALAIARQLGWGERQQELLRYAAILHDIGKIHISETTLFKSTPLTQAEWEQIRAHPITGAEMIKNVPFLAEAAPMIRHHHEQWDGSGYPDGLTGEQIPEGSRILAIADAFDAMTSPHPYGPERPLENAYQEILRLAGKRYDPNIVEAFTQVWQSGLIQSIARRV